MRDIFTDDAFIGTETNGTETFTSRSKKGHDNLDDRDEDAELRVFCRRTLGPSLDRVHGTKSRHLYVRPRL